MHSKRNIFAESIGPAAKTLSDIKPQIGTRFSLVEGMVKTRFDGHGMRHSDGEKEEALSRRR
jgi:hypothetical protein